MPWVRYAGISGALKGRESLKSISHCNIRPMRIYFDTTSNPIDGTCGIEPLAPLQGADRLVRKCPGHRPRGLSPGLDLTARWAVNVAKNCQTPGVRRSATNPTRMVVVLALREPGSHAAAQQA